MRGHFTLRKTYYFKMAMVPKLIYRFHATPIKIPVAFLAEIKR